MRLRPTPLLIAILCLATGLWTGAASATETGAPPAAEVSEAVLGSQGEIYEAVYGLAESVFGDGVGLEPDNNVLAVRIRRPEAGTELLLVPGTEGPQDEAAASLSFDDRAQTLFLTWEERTNFIHSQVRLAAYRDGVWSEPFSVSDQRLSLKFSPRMVVTRDSFHRGEGEEVEVVQRTILHMVWLEERGEGPVAVYSPMILLDGVVAGPNPRFVLTDLIRPSEEAPIPAGPTPFSPAIAPGNSDHSVIVGFFDPWNEALVGFQISALSGDVGRIAHRLEDYVLSTASGDDLEDEAALEELASGVEAHMLEIGGRLHPELLDHIAGGMRGHMIDLGARPTPPRDVPEVAWIAGRMKGHMIDLGFRLDDRGLRSLGHDEVRQIVNILPDQSTVMETETPTVGAPDGETPVPVADEPTTHVAEIRRLAAWPMPVELDDAFDTLYLSRDGKRAILTQERANELLYVETAGAGWSHVRGIPVEGEVTLEKARRMIAARLGIH